MDLGVLSFVNLTLRSDPLEKSSHSLLTISVSVSLLVVDCCAKPSSDWSNLPSELKIMFVGPSIDDAVPPEDEYELLLAGFG